MIPNILKKHIDNGNIAAAYLIIGDQASIHDAGKSIEQNFLPVDRFWLTNKEGEASIKVEQVLAFLDATMLSPVGDKKVMLVKDISTMTHAAQNKILKTLEEGNENTVFMLLATDIERILNTVRSRCVTIYLGKKDQAATKKIADDVKKLLACKSLDEAVPLLPYLTSKDNIMQTLKALSTLCKDYDILTTLSVINLNIKANCNPTNAFDLFLMEYFKQ